MQQVQKQGLNVVLNPLNEPIALVYRSKDGEWIIYTMQKATQEEIIILLEQKEHTIKALTGHDNP